MFDGLSLEDLFLIVFGVVIFEDEAEAIAAIENFFKENL